MTPGDPVAWLVVERGWPVRGRDGADLGRVDQVVGDEDKDIFNGLVVSGGGSRRYVPAERVAQITTDGIELDLDAAAFEALDEQGPQGL